MKLMCDISTLAKGRDAIGLGRISTFALLYIESLFVLMAAVQGAIVFPLLGVALIAAQTPLAINSAKCGSSLICSSNLAIEPDTLP